MHSRTEIIFNEYRYVQYVNCYEGCHFFKCCRSGTFFKDPDPELLIQIWIQQKMKEQINKYFIFNFRLVNSGLCVLYRYCTINRKWQIQ